MPKRDEAKRILPYYLSMQIQCRPLLTANQLVQLLSNVGFNQIEQHNDITFPVAPVSVIIAKKE